MPNLMADGIIASVGIILCILLLAIVLLANLYGRAKQDLLDIEKGLLQSCELYAKESVDCGKKIAQLQMMEDQQHKPLIIDYPRIGVYEETYYTQRAPEYLMRDKLN